MGRDLFVAAGGGGDAIAAVMVAAQLCPRLRRFPVATFSWDRLIVDPLPGPRTPSDFVGLETVGRWNYRVPETAAARLPAGSTLPRLARELPVDLFLLDATAGARGLQRQLQELLEILQAERVIVVDVGGDILAEGDEPSLRSPLADSLVLASVADLSTCVEVLVAGAGLDAELDADLVLTRCAALTTGARPTTLAPPHLPALPSLFEWHPSEATGLLWASVVGVRGQAEMRDHGGLVPLTDRTPELWTLDTRQVLDNNRIAQAVLSTTSLEDAEATLLAFGRTSEIEYERRKAETLSVRHDDVDLAAALDRLPEIEEAARARGTDFLTIRCLAERLAVPQHALDELRAELQRSAPDRYHPPLWAMGPSGPAAAGARSRTQPRYGVDDSLS